MLPDPANRLHTIAQRTPFLPAQEELCEVADLARRAGALGTQALGVTLSTREAEAAPLVSGAPRQLTDTLRSLMVELVIAQRARWHGAADGGGVLEVRAAPAEEQPASLRVLLSFCGAARELTLPVAAAQPL